MRFRGRVRIAFIVGCALLGMIHADFALAQRAVYPLTGNIRLQVGSGLPIPIAFTAAPNGPVVATPAAVVEQTKGPDPRPMAIAPSVLTRGALPVVLPVFPSNPNQFQISTSLAVQWPKGPVTLSAGGRTGASTVTFCPGQVVLPGGNPGCISVNGGVQNGRLRYVKTANQFGGPGVANISGQAVQWVRAGSPAPCAFTPNCLAGKVPVTPPSSFAVGGTFGATGMMGGLLIPNLFNVSVGAGGTILGTVPIATSPGINSSGTSYGGPWTTGMVTASVTVLGLPQIFMLTGSDARVNGVGSISLVAGGVTTRNLAGPIAQRGWLNLNVPEPGSAFGLIAALGTILALHVVMVRVRG